MHGDRHADGMNRTGPVCEVCGEALAAAVIEGRRLCGSCELWAEQCESPRGATDADVRQAVENVGR